MSGRLSDEEAHLADGFPLSTPSRPATLSPAPPSGPGEKLRSTPFSYNTNYRHVRVYDPPIPAYPSVLVFRGFATSSRFRHRVLPALELHRMVDVPVQRRCPCVQSPMQIMSVKDRIHPGPRPRSVHTTPDTCALHNAQHREGTVITSSSTHRCIESQRAPFRAPPSRLYAPSSVARGPRPSDNSTILCLLLHI